LDPFDGLIFDAVVGRTYSRLRRIGLLEGLPQPQLATLLTEASAACADIAVIVQAFCAVQKPPYVHWAEMRRLFVALSSTPARINRSFLHLAETLRTV
jgi:hypothetical protein